MNPNRKTLLFPLALALFGFSTACDGDDDDEQTTTTTTGDDSSDNDADADGSASEASDDSASVEDDSGSDTQEPDDDSDTTDAPSDGDDSSDGEEEEGETEEGEEQGQTSIRVMHLGVGVPAVDVFANSGTPAAVTDLDYRESTAYLDLPAADYSFQVSLAGGTPEEAAIEAGPLTLESETNYTAVAVGALADDNLEIIALVDDDSDLAEENLRLQVVHAAPAVGEVDIWNVTDAESPAPLLEDVPYKASGIVDVPPGSYNIGIDVDNDANPDLVFTADLSGVAAGTHINLYANNDAEETPGVALVAQLPDGSILTINPNE